MLVIRGRGEGGEAGRSVFLNLIAAVVVIVCSFFGTFLATSMTNNTQYFHDIQRQSVKDAQLAAAEAIKLLFDSENKLQELDNAAETDDKPWKDFTQHELEQYWTYFRGWRHDIILSYFRVRQYFGEDAADMLVHVDEELERPKQGQAVLCRSPGKTDLLKLAEDLECQIRIYSATINNPDMTYYSDEGGPIEKGQEVFKRIDSTLEMADVIRKNFDNYDLNIIKFTHVINRRLQKMGPVSYQWIEGGRHGNP
jgi:hypothetical protein